MESRPSLRRLLFENASLKRITVFVTNSGMPLNVDDEIKRVSPNTDVESSKIIEFTPLEEIDAWIETL